MFDFFIVNSMKRILGNKNISKKELVELFILRTYKNNMAAFTEYPVTYLKLGSKDAVTVSAIRICMVSGNRTVFIIDGEVVLLSTKRFVNDVFLTQLVFDNSICDDILDDYLKQIDHKFTKTSSLFSKLKGLLHV